jgi:hypothetical protein
LELELQEYAQMIELLPFGSLTGAGGAKVMDVVAFTGKPENVVVEID